MSAFGNVPAGASSAIVADEAARLYIAFRASGWKAPDITAKINDLVKGWLEAQVLSLSKNERKPYIDAVAEALAPLEATAKVEDRAAELRLEATYGVRMPHPSKITVEGVERAVAALEELETLTKGNSMAEAEVREFQRALDTAVLRAVAWTGDLTFARQLALAARGQ